MLDPHGALIYTMVIVSAAESNLDDRELEVIGSIIRRLPVFRDFDRQTLPRLLDGCTEACDAGEAVMEEEPERERRIRRPPRGARRNRVAQDERG